MAIATAKAEAARENRIDPVLLPVMANRMDAVCRDMTNTMLLAARSSVIGMARDFSCAVITSDNQVLAVAEGFPIHVWGTNIQTRSMQDLHPDYAEGDAYLHNDPYLGNTHTADHTILVPVFHEGEHFFTVAVKAHQADVGNSLPTTYMAQAGDVYQEGALIFPCVQVQRDFRDIQDIIRMCERRIRVPEQWYGDYLAAVGAARIGERALKTFVAKYGPDTVRQFVDEWFDYSERRCIEAIRKLPKGTLKGAQSHDPIEPWVPDGIPINVEIAIDPDEARVTVDLRDNVDCIDAGLNLTETTSTMAAVQGVLTCLGEDLPPNSGTMRRIEVLLRENCAVGIPRFPHSCSVATTNLTDVIVNVTQSAFAELGDGQGFAHGNYCNSAAAGVASGTDWRRDGEAYINQMFMMGGGGGASAENDGMHYLFVPVAAGLLYRDSIEINEQRFPVLIEKMHVVTDSMGHGRRRGGAGDGGDYGAAQGPDAHSPCLQRARERAQGGARRYRLAARRQRQDRAGRQRAPLSRRHGVRPGRRRAAARARPGRRRLRQPARARARPCSERRGRALHHTGNRTRRVWRRRHRLPRRRQPRRG